MRETYCHGCNKFVKERCYDKPHTLEYAGVPMYACPNVPDDEIRGLSPYTKVEVAKLKPERRGFIEWVRGLFRA